MVMVMKMINNFRWHIEMIKFIKFYIVIIVIINAYNKVHIRRFADLETDLLILIGQQNDDRW
jgi:hypothetical protein